jgi:hypothetical protein
MQIIFFIIVDSISPLSVLKIKFNIPTPVMNTTTCESTVFYFEFSCFFRMGRIKTGSLVSAALLRDALITPIILLYHHDLQSVPTDFLVPGLFMFTVRPAASNFPLLTFNPL